MKYSMAKVIAFFAFAVCLAVAPAKAGDEDLEDKFAAKFGHGKAVKWELAQSLTEEQRAAICSNAHELTGHGPATMKETSIVDVYLKFSAKYKPISTQVLLCKQNNKRQHTYFVTQGVDKNALTLIRPDPSRRKIKGKDVFVFFWTVGQVRAVPTLMKLNA